MVPTLQSFSLGETIKNENPPRITESIVLFHVAPLCLSVWKHPKEPSCREPRPLSLPPYYSLCGKMRQGGGVRRAGRAGVGEEDLLPAPRGSAASCLATTVPQAAPRSPGPPFRARTAQRPRRKEGYLGQPPASAPPLALGPSRSPTQGLQKMTPRRQTPPRPSPAPPRASLLPARSSEALQIYRRRERR